MIINRPYLYLYPRVLGLSLLIFAGFFCPTMAQNAGFIPTEDNPEFFSSLTKQYEQVYKTEVGNLPLQYKKDFESIYKQRWEHIREKFDRKEIYADKDAQQYLDGLAGEIINANPLLRSKIFRCYFSRSGVPNASYIGHGIILFNMGLFEKLNNENEAVFIISHEIAHFLLKHSENAMSDYVNAINSEEVQQKLRDIRGAEYKKREQVDKLVNSLTFDFRRHGRDHENDADSLAVELMRNTRFDLNGAITTLQILDQVDKDSLSISTILEKTFNAKEYPFRQKWLAKEEGLLGGHAIIKEDAVLADSLKTHPDCGLRMALLEPIINKYTRNNSVAVKNQAAFIALQNKFRYEVIEYSFNNSYTKSLYYTLILLQKNPDDPFLVAHTGKIFNSFYTSRKVHTFGKMTEQPSPYYSTGYNTLLQFVQNLYVEDISSIGYYFLKQYASQYSTYSFFNKTFEVSNQIVKQ